MTLLSPGFLWALLAVLPLAAIYLLKVRPRRHPVTASFLWQRVFTEKRASALFKRLRDVLSLLIMLLALTAMVLALTRPRLETARSADLLIVVDTSASMSTVDGGATRLEQAKDLARDLVEALAGERRAAVATVADEVVYRSYLTHDTRQLLDAIDAIEPTAVPLRSRALAHVAPLEQPERDFRVLLLSDAVAADFALPAGVELMRLGERRDNAGLIGADLQPTGEPGQLSLYFQLGSNFQTAREADVVLSRDGMLVKVVPVTIEGGRQRPQILDVTGEPGRYELRLDLDDALALDNVAYLAVPPPAPIRVAVTAHDRYFFEHSVQAFARGGTQLALATERADVTIDRGGDGAGRLSIIFAPAGQSPWWQRVGEPLAHVVPRQRVEDHPALRFLPVEELPFTGARQVTPPAGALVLVEDARGTPLIWQAQRGERTAVVVNMEPAASDFFFSPYFPVLIYGVTTYLGGQEQPQAAVYTTAEPVPMPGASPGTRVSLTDPSGATVEFAADHRPRLAQPGFHHVQAGQRSTWLASSLLDAGESGIEPVAVESTAGPVERGQPLAVWLLLLAIGLLVAEELAYHRRKVG